MIKQMALEFIIMLTALNMKENGKMTSNTVKVTNLGLMVVSFMDFTLNRKSKDVECINGLMETNMLGIGLTILFLAMESILGATEESMLDSGKITLCMVRELTNGQMEDCIMEIIKMIRRMGLVFMFG